MQIRIFGGKEMQILPHIYLHCIVSGVVLYSKNRFWLDNDSRGQHCYVNRYSWNVNTAPYVGPFFQQIEANASLLRHIYINFPRLEWDENGIDTFGVRPEEFDDTLELIRTACPGLKTIEIATNRQDRIFELDEPDGVGKAVSGLFLLHESSLKNMESLEKIVVTCAVFTINEEAMAARETLMGIMPNDKWIVEFYQLPPKVWISTNNMVEFINEEDCSSYNQQMYTREQELEERRQEEREQESWEWMG